MSLRLRPALESLSESLQVLSARLDAVVFSDTWRAAAIAITRTMFNDVATEARFSAEVLPTHFLAGASAIRILVC